MSAKHVPRASKPLIRLGAGRLVGLVAAVILLFAVGWWFLAFRGATSSLQYEKAFDNATAASTLRQFTANLTDSQLQSAADELLAAVDPERPENLYFSDFARERLRWMVREHSAGRLEVAFFNDTSTTRLPGDVLMAAWPRDGISTIFIGKPRFARFLTESDATMPPFTQQQKNDFALALVHEIVHLQNPQANPRDREMRAREESRAWREVTLQVVRDLIADKQPVHQRFKDVDNALRACNDQLPCPVLARLVRLGL